MGDLPLRAKTLDGHDIDLKPEVVNRLKTRLRRPLLAPGDLGYEESRTVWNSLIDRSLPFAGKASPELTLVALLRPALRSVASEPLFQAPARWGSVLHLPQRTTGARGPGVDELTCFFRSPADRDDMLTVNADSVGS